VNEILTLLQEIQDCAKKLKKAGNDEFNLHGKLNALRGKITQVAEANDLMPASPDSTVFQSTSPIGWIGQVR